MIFPSIFLAFSSWPHIPSLGGKNAHRCIHVRPGISQVKMLIGASMFGQESAKIGHIGLSAEKAVKAWGTSEVSRSGLSSAKQLGANRDPCCPKALNRGDHVYKGAGGTCWHHKASQKTQTLARSPSLTPSPTDGPSFIPISNCSSNRPSSFPRRAFAVAVTSAQKIAHPA